MAGLGRRSHYRKHLTDSVLNDLPEPTNSNQRIAKVIGTRGSNQFELVVAPPTVFKRRRQRSNNNDNNNLNRDENKNQDEGQRLEKVENDCGDKDDTNEEELYICNVVEDLDMTPQLSILPTKYRKLIWLKRNDYVICECADNDHHDNDHDDVEEESNNNYISHQKKQEPKNTIEGGIRFMITHILYKDQIKHLKEKEMWPMHPHFLDKNGSHQDGDDDESANIIEKAKALLKQEKKNNRGNDGIIYEGDDQEEEEEEEYAENYDYSDDGIVFSNTNDYFVNTNRIAKLKIEDSSSEEEDSD